MTAPTVPRCPVAGPVLREVLPNGLTLLVRPDRRFGRVALSAVYRVGFRHDPPGQDGLAHLVEHLMFTGSRSLPGNRLVTAVSEAGGAGSATTHQDYTEYHQMVPPSLVERALFGEADRMAAPTLTEVGLVQQLHAVVQEIEQLRSRPLGGFPWPLIGPLLFDHPADTHDPYGDPAVVARYTIEDCRRFVAEHYHPANAVLAVVGDVDPDRIRELVYAHFGAIPAGATTAPAPGLAGPPTGFAVGRSAVHRDPHLRGPALALGFGMPDPVTDRRAYLAAAVAARTVATAEQADASNGFFELLDARGPDVLVVACAAPAGDARATGLCRRVADLADRAPIDPALTDTAIEQARRRLVAERRRAAAGLLRNALDLARWEALFGPTVADPLPILDDLDPAEVRDAAGRLADQRPARLLLVPGAREPRPPVILPPAPQVIDTTWQPLDRRVPELMPWPSARPCITGSKLGDLGGIPVVVVPDERVTEVEVRVRVRLPDRTAAALRAAGLTAGAARRRARTVAAPFEVGADGSDLIIAGRVPRNLCGDWLSLLDDWLLATVSGTAGGTAGDPLHRVDDALRAALAERHPGRAAPLAARCLTAVGPVTVAELIDATGPALRGTSPAAPPQDPAIPPDPVHTEVDTADGAGPILLSWPVLGLAIDDPRLTVALTALHHRLFAAAAGRFPVAIACEPVLDGLRASLRAITGADDRHRVTGVLRAAARTLHEEPLSSSEVARAAQKAAGHALVPFDSPARLADSLSTATAWRGSAGIDPDRLARIPADLASVVRGPVADVAATLFGCTPSTVTPRPGHRSDPVPTDNEGLDQ